MLKTIFTALVLVCPIFSAYAETPAEVENWYRNEVEKANANLENARSLARNNPSSPYLSTSLLSMERGHQNLMAALRSEYNRRMQRATAQPAHLPIPPKQVAPKQNSAPSTTSRQQAEPSLQDVELMLNTYEKTLTTMKETLAVLSKVSDTAQANAAVSHLKATQLQAQVFLYKCGIFARTFGKQQLRNIDALYRPYLAEINSAIEAEYTRLQSADFYQSQALKQLHDSQNQTDK